MLTSRRSARVDFLRGLAAAASVLVACGCLADSAGRASAALSKAETAALTRAAQVAIKQQDDLPTDNVAAIAWLGPLRRDPLSERGRLVTLAVVRFSGIANRYCRVFVSDGELASAKLVPIPAAANYDQCLSAGPLLVLDLDGDGIADLVHTVKLRSNRYPSTVSETVVYLGRSDAVSGYCYSADASRELAAADTVTTASLAKAAAVALKRLGKPSFACSTP